MKAPELTEAVLDPTTLEALLEDVAANAELLDVAVKGGATQRAHVGAPDLAFARAALRDGGRVQLRYRWDGVEWRDTVLPVAGGFRVVRTRVDVP